MKEYWMKMRAFLSKRNKIVYVIVFGIIIILAWPFTNVGIGHKMVSYNMLNGKIKVEEAGIHFAMPFIEDKLIFPTTEQVYTICRDSDNWAKGLDGSIQVQTKDSQTISMDLSVIYQLNEDKLTEFYADFHVSDISDIEKNYIELYLKSVVSNISSTYTVNEIYSHARTVFEDEVIQELKKQMESYHIVVNDVLINNIRISDTYQELLDAKIKAEKDLIEANNVGKINRIFNETLTENVLQYKSIQELSDNVKIIVVPSDTNSQINLGELYTEILDE